MRPAYGMDIVTEGGMVSSGHPASAIAGMKVLERGGNAVDAAVTAAFVEIVVEPAHSGLAGGGSMLVYLAEQQRAYVVDYNTCAPAGATPELFASDRAKEDESEADSQASRLGCSAVSVPGTLAGLSLALERFGTCSLREALEPAIERAEQGFRVHGPTADAIRAASELLGESPEAARVLMPRGSPPPPGDRMSAKELGTTLGTIAQEGIGAFYQGTIGRAVCEYVQRMGGILTPEDLTAYRAQLRAPLRCTYRGYELLAAPLPSGGLSALQALNVLAPFDLAEMPPQGPEFVHTEIEALKLVSEDRNLFFGDPDFVSVDVPRFLSKEYAAGLSREIGEVPLMGGHPASDGGGEASQLCVVDAQRNMVSLSQSLGSAFGSLALVPKTGIVLNNGLSGFDPGAGLPNSVAPHKRPLNSTCPLLILKEGRPAACLGIAGGREVISGMVQLVVNLLELDMTVSDAVSAGRFHSQHAGRVLVENQHLDRTLSDTEAASDSLPGSFLSNDTCQRLQEMGHDVEHIPKAAGFAHVIQIDPLSGRLCSAVDPRGEGLVAATE